MADIVVFGADSAGAKRCDELARTDRVICFADFDRAKVGTTFHGRPVVAAPSLLDLPFDRVALTTQDPAGTLSFLLRLGIPLARIEAVGGGATEAAGGDPRPTAVIFGARIHGIRTMHHIKARFRVVCFCDSDPALQGRRIAGLFVVAPADLRTLSYDRIFLGVAETYKVLHELLWQWGVPIEKMDVVPESVLLPPEPAIRGARPRYVVFGAGSSGERVFRHLAAQGEVVGFVDNSRAKHGTEFCGRPVHAPEALAGLDYDRVVIGSMYTAEILGQLMELGIDTGRIVVLDSAIVLGTALETMKRVWWRLFRRGERIYGKQRTVRVAR